MTSNVRSHQTTNLPYSIAYTGAGLSGRKTRPSDVDFTVQDCGFETSSYAYSPSFTLGTKVYASNFPGPSGCDFPVTLRKGNTAYGCQAELLPNPDVYCVEKVTNNGQATGAFTTVYLKEFTKQYNGSISCSAITAVPGKTFKLMSKEDFGYYETSTKSDRNLIHTLTAFSSRDGSSSYNPNVPAI